METEPNANLNNPAPAPTSGSPAKSSGCATLLVVAIAIFWVIPVSCGRLVPMFGASINPGRATQLTAQIGALIQILLIGVPLTLLTIIWKAPTFRAVLRTWLIALLLVVLLMPIYWIPEIATQLQFVLQSLILLLFIAALMLLSGRAKV